MHDEFYIWLDENDYFWSRISPKEIVVLLHGFVVYSEEHEALMEAAKRGKHTHIAEDFDYVSRKTYYRFSHA